MAALLLGGLTPLDLSATCGIAVLAVALAGVLAGALRVSSAASSVPPGTRVAAGEARHRQGVFQRVTHPAAPGRPRPRAPQSRLG
jgi:hypothetical protein